MDKKINLKSTVTSKRQITIPKEVCELLNIKRGDQALFIMEDDRIIFDIRKESVDCFACFGEGKLYGEECFVCKGEGVLNNDELKDVYKLISKVMNSSLKYSVSIGLQQDSSTIFSKVSIIKSNLPKDQKNRIQDEIQKLIISQQAPRSIQDINKFCTPTDILLEEILGLLSTDSAKEEVKNWFR
ncbi:MAG: hypothetical protein N4A40_13155 [Tissierellales bacterium]|nr:hypothetical protein [Tissierellales bacterium]